MIKWIKDLFYKIFYKRTAKKALLVMEDCEAYKNYRKSNEIEQNGIKRINNTFIGSVNTKIDLSTSDGEYQIIKKFNSNSVPRKNQKEIKQYFIDKGYKVKIKRIEMIGGNDRKIIISWKHWNKI